MAVDYMKIYCLGTLFTQLTLGLNAFITAQGKTLISMCNVAVGAVTNIILDAVFINGICMFCYSLSHSKQKQITFTFQKYSL